MRHRRLPRGGAPFRTWMVGGKIGSARYRIMLGFLVGRLAASRWNRLKLMLLVPLMPMRDRLRWPARPFHVRLRYRRLEVNWRLGAKTDAELLHEILVSGCYSAVPESNPRVILDLGANSGISLLYLRATYPAARLIGIEPNPVTFGLLRSNARELGAEVHQFAVTANDGPTTLSPNSLPTLSSLADGGEEAVTVEGRSLDSLFHALGLERVDLLKIDIEGGEFGALRGARRLPDVHTIIGEVHDSADPGGREALFSILNEFDITVESDTGDTAIFVATRLSDGQ